MSKKNPAIFNPLLRKNIDGNSVSKLSDSQRLLISIFNLSKYKLQAISNKIQKNNKNKQTRQDKRKPTKQEINETKNKQNILEHVNMYMN